MKKLNNHELDIFVSKYFKVWKKDIKKVTCFKYNGKTEYLINDHYLFVTKDKYE